MLRNSWFSSIAAQSEIKGRQENKNDDNNNNNNNNDDDYVKKIETIIVRKIRNHHVQ